MLGAMGQVVNRAAYLQRALGNQALALLATDHSAAQATIIQAKLTVGPVGDAYEQEADQVAKAVTQQISAASPQGMTQRQETLDEEEDLQMKPQISVLQRAETAGRKMKS